ncbi:MAG: hypothetical protein OCD01_19215 [Fibrobacterales bacterium]
MQTRIDEWKKRITQLKSDTVSGTHKYAYADSVVTQAETFLLVGNESVALRLLERLDIWADRQGAHLQVKSKTHQFTPFANTFGPDLLEREFKNLKRFFINKQLYIPKPDKESIASELADIQKKLSEEVPPSTIQQDIQTVKKRLFDRLHRSLRAQFSASVFMRPFAKIDNQVGPYNNANNVSEVCKLISERDAIWIDDLIQLYGSLFKLEDKITGKRK